MKIKYIANKEAIDGKDYIGKEFCIENRLWTVFRADPDDPYLLFVRSNLGEVGTITVTKVRSILTIDFEDDQYQP